MIGCQEFVVQYIQIDICLRYSNQDLSIRVDRKSGGMADQTISYGYTRHMQSLSRSVQLEMLCAEQIDRPSVLEPWNGKSWMFRNAIHLLMVVN